MVTPIPPPPPPTLFVLKYFFNFYFGTDILQVPSTPAEWIKISSAFEDRWNYPFCLGALDGKHIAVRQPANSGSEFFNYKHFYSVVLMALVDARYRFVFVDVGATGRSGDAGVFDRCTLNAAMTAKTMGFPDPALLGTTEKKCSYHIIGDDAFPLREELMKPYPFRNLARAQRIFNYRLSRARRVVENAFGILSSRFRVFLTTIGLEADKVEKLVLAAVCLHNFLIDTQPLPQHLVDHEDDQHQLVQGVESQLHDTVPTTARNHSVLAKNQRDRLRDYFNSDEGSVAWQDNVI